MKKRIADLLGPSPYAGEQPQTADNNSLEDKSMQMPDIKPDYTVAPERPAEESMQECFACDELRPLLDFAPGRNVCRRCRTAGEKSKRHRGTQIIVNSRKQCSLCLEWKAVDAFYKRPEKSTGLESHCRDCKNEDRTRRRREDPQRQEKDHAYAVARYGLSPEQYAEMLALQRGVCAICQEDPDGGRKLCVDHDHTSGRVRGLLCRRCNTAVGHMKDDPQRMRSAALYLEREPHA